MAIFPVQAQTIFLLLPTSQRRHSVLCSCPTTDWRRNTVFLPGLKIASVPMNGCSYAQEAGKPTEAKPAATNSAPSAVLVGDGQPAPVNEFKGMQEREEVFEFAEKPKVSKEGDPSAGSGQVKWVVTFASKGKCDATVAIVDEDGKDDRGEQLSVNSKQSEEPPTTLHRSLVTVYSPPFRVRVSLGLKATLDKLLGDEPRLLAGGSNLACDAQGNVYFVSNDRSSRITLLDREGNYVQTIFPPPATMPPEKWGVAVTKRID